MNYIHLNKNFWAELLSFRYFNLYHLASRNYKLKIKQLFFSVNNFNLHRFQLHFICQL
jgi:hypothetical protein